MQSPDALRTHKFVLNDHEIYLRPMTENDWDLLVDWNNRPEVLRYSEGDPTDGHPLETVKRIYRGVSQHAYCFIIMLANKPIGECWIQEMNLKRIREAFPSSLCYRIDLMIGESTQWGRGIGTRAIAMLTEFGFHELRADMIFGCDIQEENKRCIGAFRRNKYKRLLKKVGTSKFGIIDVLIARRQNGHKILED